MATKLPTVAIIGRANAGKSSLFNRMMRSQQAIVAREAGTTRDRVVGKAAYHGHEFWLVDTAGLKPAEDEFEASIQEQITDASDAADVILVVVDSTEYPSDEDRRVAKTALKSRKPVILIANKTDLRGSLPTSEFLRLGIKSIIRTSAEHNSGISDALDEICQHIPEKRQAEPSDVLKIALIGRPNVGKSSLFNRLGQKQQAITSSKQGTTRDINRLELKFKGQTIEFLDTAGLRKPGKREVGIEKFSAIRTLSAIEESDICLLLVDSTEPHSKLDQSLAGQIIEAGKSVILVITKSDLLDNSTPVVSTISDKSKPTELSQIDNILDNLEHDFNFLSFAPVIITSSETGKNVTKLFELITEVDLARHTELKTSELNKVLNEAVISHPPAGLKNTHPKLQYITQTDTCPPWFVIHGREMELLHWSYKRYLERCIREKFPFLGTPLKFSFHNDRKNGPRKSINRTKDSL